MIEVYFVESKMTIEG